MDGMTRKSLTAKTSSTRARVSRLQARADAVASENLGLSMIVGLVAGLAAIGFYLVTQAAFAWAMGSLAGYQPEPHPAGEPDLAWLPTPAAAFLRGCCSPFRPWAVSPAGC